MPVVPVYERFADVTPRHTAGLVPNVIVGNAFTVTTVADEVAEHPLLFATVTV